MQTESSLPSWSRGLRPRRGRVVALVALLLWAGGAAAAGPCPAPDVWVASSRRQPGICRLPERAALDVERLTGNGCGRWERAGVGDLLAESERPLVVFVHGNRYAASEAKAQGVQLARRMAAFCPDAGPTQTLIFSWPSERQGALLRDVRAKYDRAHADGHYLAWLLRQVDPGRPVAIVGYSYGAIVGLEALRDLAAARGHDAGGIRRPGRTHLVLVVPAVRRDAVAPGGSYHGVVAGVDRLTVVSNSDDCALEYFDWLDRRDRVEALGYTGLPRCWVPADVEYAAWDAAPAIGPLHRLPLYLESGPLMRRIAGGAVAGLAEPRPE